MRLTRTLYGLLGLLVVLSAPASRADEPPPAPELITISSPQHRYVAVSDPQKSETRVFRGAPSGTPLWTVDGWHSVLFLSDDGTLAIGQPGNNLLERDYKPGDVLVQLYRDGKLTRTVTVGEVIPDPKLLRATTSHWSWGVFEGFSDGRFWLKREDGKRFGLDPASAD